MKKLFFIALVASMAMLAACGSDSSSSPTGASGSGQLSSKSVAAFFPTGYKTEDVVAWFATDVQTVNEGNQTKTLLDAVYLFKDGSFVATESKLKVKSDKTTLSNDIATTGTWSGTSNDFQNGSFEISFVFESENGSTQDMTLPIEIKNGVFTMSPMGDYSLTFKLQSSKVPTPAETGDIVEKADSGTNSSNANEVCSVTSSGNTVTMVAKMDGVVSQMSATIDGEYIVYTIDGRSETQPRDGVTLAQLKAEADESCEEMKRYAADYDNDDYEDDYDDDDYYDDGEETSAPDISGMTCEVRIGDNSVAVVTSMMGYSSTTVYTLTDSGYMITYEGENEEPFEVPTPMTMEGLKSMAESTCEAFK